MWPHHPLGPDQEEWRGEGGPVSPAGAGAGKAYRGRVCLWSPCPVPAWEWGPVLHCVFLKIKKPLKAYRRTPFMDKPVH